MGELSSKLLTEITKRLAESIHPELIYLFGSHAVKQADEYSDVDLLIVVADTDKSTREIAIEGRASLLGLEITIDLVVCTQSQMQKWADVKCTLIYTVTRKGKIIYESEGRTGKRMAHVS